MSSRDFRNRMNTIMSDYEDIEHRLETEIAEIKRVKNVARNTPQILDDLDEQFAKKTGLDLTDTSILFVAVGLQIARQYLLTKFPERKDDQSAAQLVKKGKKEKSNRGNNLYNPSLDEINRNPVPFDANIGANGALKGGGRLGHRATAIGHDPILGLIFGTANIATATLTTSSFLSYHIYTNENNRDAFGDNARTDLVLQCTANKLLSQGSEGKLIVATSLIKEIIHLKSDINTKNSLPLPVIPAFSPKLASELADYGLDMANVLTVGKQVNFSCLINALIAMVHKLFYDGSSDIDKKLYEVKTRKILSYSNIIASSSNLAVVAIKKDMKLLDLGGLGVTIYRVITDKKFIKEVKREFIFGTYTDMVMGTNL